MDDKVISYMSKKMEDLSLLYEIGDLKASAEIARRCLKSSSSKSAKLAAKYNTSVFKCLEKPKKMTIFNRSAKVRMSSDGLLWRELSRKEKKQLSTQVLRNFLRIVVRYDKGNTDVRCPGRALDAYVSSKKCARKKSDLNYIQKQIERLRKELAPESLMGAV